MPRKLNILITAGPTQEPLDPVRYLTNASSGKMGYALANAAITLGHRVTLVSGPVSLQALSKTKVIQVQTALEMRTQVMRHLKKQDVVIMVAAVADYRPKHFSKQKMKKTRSSFTLKLVRNPDILKEVCAKKRKNQIIVGFAAETEKFLKNAKRKLHSKKCDWIILNDVSGKKIGFNSDKNKITLLNQGGTPLHLGPSSKKSLAYVILQTIFPFL